MIEETATVIGCEQNRARLEVLRQSTCNSCQAKSGCGTAVLSRTVGQKVSQITVENTLNLQVGDKVIIGLQESALLSGSFIVYLVPLLMMLVFAMLGQWVSNLLLTEASELLVIGFAIVGFVLAIKLTRRFSRKISNDVRYQPVMLRKLIN
ncbi:MAG: SoxR reducing system RseC family protein [Thioalkalispiraceae bacterium]|jgi:sigma-E factor negative regulatory protein RseC